MMYIQSNGIVTFISVYSIIVLFTTIVLAVMAFPTIPQTTLWKSLDCQNINFIGKLILCILTFPFTISYTIIRCLEWVTEYLVKKTWDLFCKVFRKK